MNQNRPSGQVDIDEYDAQFATNSRGVFFGVQKIVPVLRDGGSVLLVSSIASAKVLDGHAVYAAQKRQLKRLRRAGRSSSRRVAFG